MTTPQHYYYLIAGLPEILLEQPKPPFSSLEFREELKYHLPHEDFLQAGYLFLPFDNHNLLNLLLKKQESWDERGNFSAEQMESSIRDEEGLPSYMLAFIQAFRQEIPLQAGMSWENQLTTASYDYIIGKTTGFLQDWFRFERDMRNVLAALSARKHKMAMEGQILGASDVAEAIRQHASRDFGLGGEFPVVEKLLQIEEEENLLQREFQIDKVRWSYIDELTTFEYFTLPVLLGYLIKLFMLERWKPLDNADGLAVLERLIGDLKNSFEFPKEFILS